MFIDPSAGGDARGAAPPAPQKRQRPLGFYLRGIVRTPSWTFSDIAIDQPLARGTGLLLGGLGIAGAIFGVGGLLPDFDGVTGLVVGSAGFALGGYAGFLVLTILLHLIAKIFEGEASIAEELSTMTYAALSSLLLVPTALLWLVLAGTAGTWALVLGAMVAFALLNRWTYLAIREANRFVGTQAILTMLMVPLGAGLTAIAAFFVFAFGSLIVA